ncbi:BTAD domain-containing putative transcriptional regulator [Streptomyces sp. NPDC058469]|uniref:BTAD domain-containing putative transcriptional regulator n=1 Tax=Streptomyces sp. NPDC058469 TaxID=3346514 RepID=UPI00364796E7
MQERPAVWQTRRVCGVGRRSPFCGPGPAARSTWRSGGRRRAACALAQRIDADLHLGRHRELLPELTVLVNQDRMHESLHGQFMVALHRVGSARTRHWTSTGDCHHPRGGTVPGAGGAVCSVPS